MQTFQTFRQYLRELYDTEVDPTWTSQVKPSAYSGTTQKVWNATFTLDALTYVVEFSAPESQPDNKRQWVVSFYLVGADERPQYMLTRTNKGNTVKVGGAILNIVAGFMRQYKPASVEFAAEEPERIPLYRKIVPILATRTGYTPDTSSESPDIFRLLRP
jgi:hypothetical protein